MLGPGEIFMWIAREIKPMRRSRQKTLACVTEAAMRLRGAGVLALGRCLDSGTTIKHAIKRVGRFFANDGVEMASIQQALVNHLAPPKGKPCVVLVDWTEVERYKTLVASLPRDGRSLPVWWMSIEKKTGEGAMVQAEKECLLALKRLFLFTPNVIVVADRGFGNTRWLRDVEKLGMGYVQRVSGPLHVENDELYCALHELGVSRGDHVKDWGAVRLTLEALFPTRLVTTFAAEAKEAWFLATNRAAIPQEIVRIYQRRMWIEEAFRDLKNREWGLGMVPTELSDSTRQDRLWAVLALAYFFLSAFGAEAERCGADRQLRHDTGSSRLMNLAKLGFLFLGVAAASIPAAIAALNALPP
jgi:hypothetical protein